MAQTVDVSVCDTNEQDQHDSVYFQSYNDIAIHELMLRDTPRTKTYKDFILNNTQLFKDKIVIDVGAGTGILSLFAAKAGAKKVYAIEASDIVEICKQIIAWNKFSDVIQVIHGRVEDVDLGADVKADVIISEWMGFYLLHESMLDSVITARDRWLSEGGVMLPSHGSLEFCPVNMDSYCTEKFDFWKDVFGFDYTPIIPLVVSATLKEPIITEITSKQTLAESQTLVEFDFHTVSREDIQSFSKITSFTFSRSCRLHGYAFWFVVEFMPSVSSLSRSSLSPASLSPSSLSPSLLASSSPPVHETLTQLSTSPSSPVTHWKQTVVMLPVPLLVETNDSVRCQIGLEQNKSNKRHYNISVELLDLDLSESGVDINLDLQEFAESTDQNKNDSCKTDKNTANSNNEDDSDEDSDSEMEDEHPMPCECNAPRCRIIKALMEKYDEQEDVLMNENDVIDITSDDIAQVDDGYCPEDGDNDSLSTP